MTNFASNARTPIAMSQFLAFERKTGASRNSVRNISNKNSVSMLTNRTVNPNKMISLNKFESNLGKLCSLLDISDHSEEENNIIDKRLDVLKISAAPQNTPKRA